jgi:hypothetical protein
MAEDPAFLRNEPQFLAHLEALHRFPGEFEFKIICAGQESLLALKQPLAQLNKKVFLIGGSQEAGELDAKR